MSPSLTSCVNVPCQLRQPLLTTFLVNIYFEPCNKSNSLFGDCNVEEIVECQDSSQIEYVKYIQKNLLNISFHSLRLIPAAQYSITRNI